MPKKRVGLYPGTFDPVTLGHLDIIKRAVKLVDHLVIGVATNPSKSPLFTLEERVEMVRHESGPLAGDGRATIEVRTFGSPPHAICRGSGCGRHRARGSASRLPISNMNSRWSR